MVVYVLFAISNFAYLYFYAKDFEWNPFDFEYSQISFKSIILSSIINLIIFVSKPSFNDIMRYLKGKIGKCKLLSKSNTKIINKKRDYQRCGTVYKRPYLKWYDIKSSIDDMNYVALVDYSRN